MLRLLVDGSGVVRKWDRDVEGIAEELSSCEWHRMEDVVCKIGIAADVAILRQ